MDLENIKKAKTTKLGKEIVYYPIIDSTQEEAKRLVNRPLKNGTILFADQQTSGKGTKGRTWYSKEKENIMMTIVLYPDCEICKLEGLTTKIATTMVDTIKELYDIKLEIKQPNDLLLNGKKIAGILTESATYQDMVQHLLIGIGFNINQIEFEEEIKEQATSLKKEYKRDFDSEEIIIKFIEKLEEKIE